MASSSSSSNYKLLRASLILAAMLLLFFQTCLAQMDKKGDALVIKSFLHQRRLLPFDCSGKCDGRCSVAGERKRCLQLCMICCNKCQCVPPGTAGNKEVCPCYANLKNSKGTGKCP